MSTFRQKLVASKLVENGGNIGKAMIAAGYSPATAKTPQKLTQSIGWKELMETYLPDKLLVKRHKQLLNKKEVIVIGRGADREAFPTGQIDANAVAKGLDMAYKIRDKYPKPQVPENFDEEMRAFVLIIRKRLPK